MGGTFIVSNDVVVGLGDNVVVNAGAFQRVQVLRSTNVVARFKISAEDGLTAELWATA